jgi:hypothetical protein
MFMSAQDSVVRPQHPALHDELLRRRAIDQDARRALMKLFSRSKDGVLRESEMAPDDRTTLAHLKNVDHDNTRWLRDIVEEEGWPTLTLVGDDGASAAWLLIQHADHDPSFQRTCLDLMKALPPQETAPQHIAYLTDRVLLAEGQNQVYGTQMEIANGTHQPRNLRDPATVDQRRAEVGLGSIAEYIHSMNRNNEDH